MRLSVAGWVGAVLALVLTAGAARAQTEARFTAIEAGTFHACGIVPGGGLRCWGANDWYQVGVGRVGDRRYPRPPRGARFSTIAVTGGENHSCAVTAAHRLRCWGRNVEGQLGTGDVAANPVPGPVGGPRPRYVAIAAGMDHTCALTAAGIVRCWGANAQGALGDGTTEPRNLPTLVTGLTGRQAQIGVGYQYSCALSRQGAVRCWGRNGNGRLGDGSVQSSTVPVGVLGLQADVAGLSVGINHACAVDGAGQGWCWGGNDLGQIGNGVISSDPVTAPVMVEGLPAPVQAIEGGGGHSCAIAGAEGAVYCWGWNLMGQLGDGSTTDSATPVAVTGLPGAAVALALGDLFSCALLADQRAFCWGSNDRGQLGTGTTNASNVPQPVLMP